MKFTVAKKLWFGFGTILGLLVIVGAISLWATITIDKEYTFLLDDRVKKVELIDEFILSIMKYKVMYAVICCLRMICI